jgi:hypothetical protein
MRGRKFIVWAECETVSVLPFSCLSVSFVSVLYFLFLIVIPCIHEYVENNQQNALNSILLYFAFYDGSYMFRRNNVILREQLCFFLSHFNVNMVGDNSDLCPTILTLKWLRKEHSCFLRMILFCRNM